MKTKIVTIRFRESSEYTRDFAVAASASEERIRREFEALTGEEQKRGADLVGGSWEIVEVQTVAWPV